VIVGRPTAARKKLRKKATGLSTVSPAFVLG